MSGATRQVKISAVVNTLNERDNIERCLGSLLPWADEVIVADMASEDGTVEFAEAAGARVIRVERATHVEPARAAAIGVATGGWVLVLDADEMLPRSLAMRLEHIAQQDEADAVVIPRRNFMFGTEMRSSGWQMETDRHLRFFKPGAVEWSPKIHSLPATAPTVRKMVLPARPELALVHFNYLDVSQFIEKLNRYTDIEAGQIAGPAGTLQLLRAILTELWTRIVRARGYRGGWRAVTLTMLMVTYRVATWAKAQERAEVGSREDIRAIYSDVADTVLREWAK